MASLKEAGAKACLLEPPSFRPRIKIEPFEKQYSDHEYEASISSDEVKSR